jgi:hypothetical protein
VNIFLWVLQILLALHTLAGAIWKFSNSSQALPSLRAIPPAAWLGLSVVEILCSLALIAPAVSKPLGILAPIAAACIAAEMLLFVALHVSSGSSENGQMTYWLVVAAICAFLAYARFVLKPFS